MKRVVPLAAALLAPLAVLTQEKKEGYESSFELPGSRAEVYKTIGDVKLKVYIYEPKGHKAGAKRPAIVFFFGGGWTGGTPKQFQEHCRYLASKGMVAMTADYRVSSRQGTKPFHCVRDGKSAVRWIRQNARRLGVDPNRIVSGGGSAGGHVAACTGILPEHNEPGEDDNVSSVPNVLVLYNPVISTALADGVKPYGGDNNEALMKRLGLKEPATLSPYHNIRKGLPPTLVLHGKADTTVPYLTAEAYVKQATKTGLRAELAGYDDMPHGFFNLGRYDNKMFLATVTRMHEFLGLLGYVKDRPTVEKHLKRLAKRE
ncbi:MAG: alpha/beta hydrolase [Verrucomicrobiota bacterium]|jgi:acetyl esterase/lipase|nr:alpha/beta hydrolase [Verrucomicrobiota bacterium]MDP7292191.1 alpha/beta hydrolase [Verrucomicrobiota bacterium]|tara:strand:- start:784 stop:1731 length:948 start_codon:yes stop_codon:yes gene_type:complete